MRPSPNKFSSYRPRVLTLIVFCVVTATIMLANLTFDEPWIGPHAMPTLTHLSYGWPIIWHRLVLDCDNPSFGWHSIIGWYYSAPRLAANLVSWLILLTASSGACEWLVRRYRPRLRWSMRTLLIFVAVMAGLCAWYAKARNRAALEDEIIYSNTAAVSVERWGPKWLDLLGMDRFRRCIVRATLYDPVEHTDPSDERLLQLARLPDLRYIELWADELTPAAATTLGGMRQLHALRIRLDRLTPSLPAALAGLRHLRSLSVTLESTDGIETTTAGDDDARLVDECLAAIGQMTRLEALSLSVPLRGESLARLSPIKGLKSLQLDFWTGEWNGSEHWEPYEEGCLRAVGTLTQLEWLSLQYPVILQELRVRNESLGYLAGLTELHTLSLSFDRPTLSHLPPLPRLEALDLSGVPVDDDDLRRVSLLPRLKSLSFGSATPTPTRLRCTRAGLAQLASAPSLEELRLDSASPEHLLGLLALKRLKKLHSGSLQMVMGGMGELPLKLALKNELTLAEERAIEMYGLGDFRRAMAALRESNPDLIIDGEEMPIFRRIPDRDRLDLGVDRYDADPDRPSSWVPGGDLGWMTPQELAKFAKEGGRASFYGVTWRQGAQLVTVEFEAPRRGR